LVRQGNNNRGASARNTTVPLSTTVTFEVGEYWVSDPNDKSWNGTFPCSKLMAADFDKDDKLTLPPVILVMLLTLQYGETTNCWRYHLWILFEILLVPLLI
jgi:hypothetical protein